MTKNLPKSGHLSGHLRNAFIELVDSFNVERDEITLQTKLEVEELEKSVNWLLGQLWNCTDIMPAFTCEALNDVCDIHHEIKQGSTYAQGARFLKEIL